MISCRLLLHWTASLFYFTTHTVYSIWSWEGISSARGHLCFAVERGIWFCPAQFPAAVCAVHLSVRLGLCPTLLAMRWPFSLGISNLHNHCWLLLTGLSHCLSVWLETPWKSAGCQNNFSLNDFPLSSAAGSESIIFHRVHKNRGFTTLATYPLHQLSTNIYPMSALFPSVQIYALFEIFTTLFRD